MNQKPPQDGQSDEGMYIPLSDRLNQDVLHDNFIPKYSALASAPPSRLVLIGVWMIFLPSTIYGLVMLFWGWSTAPDLATAVVSSIAPVFIFAIAAWILCYHTRRYLRSVPTANTRS